MPIAKIITTDAGEFTARELTVGQVRDALDEIAKGVPHVVDLLFAEEGVPAAVVSLSTGIPGDAKEGVSLMDFTPGDMRKILSAVSEVNPDFLALAGRMRELAGKQTQPEPGGN